MISLPRARPSGIASEASAEATLAASRYSSFGIHRRPERSYYTLNENLTGDKPRRIQLHGYGNEHHGEHKQHIHKIPQKVLDFCDRWEKEILAPWFAEQRREAAKKKHTKKENAA